MTDVFVLEGVRRGETHNGSPVTDVWRVCSSIAFAEVAAKYLLDDEHSIEAVKITCHELDRGDDEYGEWEYRDRVLTNVRPFIPDENRIRA